MKRHHRVYACPTCRDSGQVLNVERVMSREEAGPGYPSAFDPCEKCAPKPEEAKEEVESETP